MDTTKHSAFSLVKDRTVTSDLLCCHLRMYVGKMWGISSKFRLLHNNFKVPHMDFKDYEILNTLPPQNGALDLSWKVLISLYMLDCRSPPGSVLPGDASVLCVPSCDLLLPHVSCHLVLHQNLGDKNRKKYYKDIQAPNHTLTAITNYKK